MRRGRLITWFMAGVLVLAIAPVAVAQQHPACANPGTAEYQMYCSEQAGVAGEEFEVNRPAQQPAGVAVTSAPTVGVLPFTGSELAIFTVVGGALLVAGFALRTGARDRARP